MQPENEKRHPASSEEQRFINDVRNFAQQVIDARISVYDLKFKRKGDDPDKLRAAIRKELVGSSNINESENEWDSCCWDVG